MRNGARREPPRAITWRLASLLRDRDLTAPQFAARLRGDGYEISASEVYRLVQRPPQRYDADLLAAICRSLGCGLEDLLEYDPLAAEGDRLPPAFRIPGT